MDTPLLVSTGWLAAHLDDPNVRIVDVRWYLLDKDRTGRSEYMRGHIPGALFLDIETDLSSPRGMGPGRHPLPSPTAFAEVAARTGIGAATHVVAYDDRGGATAARLWWLLCYFGHEQVSLLDGGIVAWIAQGHPLQTELPPPPSRASFVARPQSDRVVDRRLVDALRQHPRGLVLDSRVPERYEGKLEPIDPKPGHIPGAKNAPLGGNLISPDDPRFLDPGALRARYTALGADKAERVVAYCGSGVNACQTLFAMQLAGIANALLYEGSWSDWSSEPDAPVALGPTP
jgi:thiosulfate/3-mercaptopyruvate sulfurtransferase